jgi:hypothetical protein
MTNAIVESAEDTELFLKILKKPDLPTEGTTGDSSESYLPSKNVGFVKLSSRKKSTFADARSTIQQELDTLPPPGVEWRFFVPGLGPVGSKQEESLGPLYFFLRKTTLDSNLGDGTLLNPLKVFIVDLKEATG